MKVLLVSANPLVTEQVTSALAGREGTDILRVATPQRAVHQMDEQDPDAFDVVVGDNDTHPTGGYFLAREVKARGQMGRRVPPVILLLARPQDRWLANWSQADAYVIKPVDPFDLLEVVDAVVEGRRIPALPRVGGEPTRSPLDVPSGEREVAGFHGAGGLTGGGP